MMALSAELGSLAVSSAWRPALAMALVAILSCPHAVMALDLSASVRMGATATDNVRLEPSDSADSDFYVELTPSIRIKESGARFNASLGYLPRIIFSPFDLDRSETQNTLSGRAHLEAVPRTILLDTDVSMRQDAFSPFGATALDDGTRSSNFADTTSYGLGAAWIGNIGADIRHEMRYRTKHVSTDGASGLDSVATQWSASITKAAVRRFGWQLSFQRRQTDYSVRPDSSSERYIGGVSYRVSPDLLLSANAGTDRHGSVANAKSTTTYGLGMNWTPTSRSKLSAKWDHRYFGEAYSISMDHRFRHSHISFVADRTASTFAERFLDADVADDETGELLLADRLDKLYPDAANREVVEQNIRSRGYSAEDFLLAGYTDRISRRDSARLSYAVSGNANTLKFAIFRRAVETVIEDFSPDVPADLGLNANNTQTGVSVTHSHRFTPRATLHTNIRRSNTVSTLPGNDTESTETSLRVSISQKLTARTTASIGVRYRNLDSNQSGGFTEHAVHGSVIHNF